MAGRVAGGGDHDQEGVAEPELLHLFQIAVDPGHRGDLHTEDRSAHLGRVQQKPVFRGEVEGHAVLAAQKLHPHRMVEMAVGIDSRHGLQPPFVDEILQSRILLRIAVSGVYDDALLRVIPDDVGIFLNRIENKGRDVHDCMR